MSSVPRSLVSSHLALQTLGTRDARTFGQGQQNRPAGALQSDWFHPRCFGSDPRALHASTTRSFIILTFFSVCLTSECRGPKLLGMCARNNGVCKVWLVLQQVRDAWQYHTLGYLGQRGVSYFKLQPRLLNQSCGWTRPVSCLEKPQRLYGIQKDATYRPSSRGPPTTLGRLIICWAPATGSRGAPIAVGDPSHGTVG